MENFNFSRQALMSLKEKGYYTDNGKIFSPLGKELKCYLNKRKYVALIGL